MGNWTTTGKGRPARPLVRLTHQNLTDSAFDWPSEVEKPVEYYRDHSRIKSPRVARSADYFEAVNLLEEFDDVDNAALDEIERFQDKWHRAPMLDEVDDE